MINSIGGNIMKIAIVEDNQSDRAIIKSYVSLYMQEHGLSVEIMEYENAEEFLEAHKKEKFRAVFLDIYMNGKTGIEAAQEIFSLGGQCGIIFISSSTEFFRQSYAVNAIYYLVKPIVEEEFQLAMKFLKLVPQYDVDFIQISYNGVERSIFTQDILYIDVQDHTTTVHTIEQPIKLNASFCTLTNSLDKDRRFLKCLRGVIVNMQHIIGVDGNMFIMDNGEKIPINIRYLKQITQKWRTYLYQQMEEK